ncbi:MAG: hypothetical protein AB8G05_16605 [Oligoflexales bacterium]
MCFQSGTNYEMFLEENGEVIKQLDKGEFSAGETTLTGINLEYHFEKMQKILISICGQNGKEIAETPIPVADILTKKKPKFYIQKKGSNNIGELIISDKSYTSDYKEIVDIPEEKIKRSMFRFGRKNKEKTDTKKAPNPTKFLEIMDEGLEISVQFGVDFTSSNGSDIRSPSSLHHFTDEKKIQNPYQEAIRKVGDIVAQYDDDQWFPAFGYGCQVPRFGRSLYFPPFFHINMNKNPECRGIEGVLAAYNSALPKIKMGDMGSADYSGYKRRFRGDDFHQLISAAVKTINKNENKYMVLTLIIDGDYFDNQATIDTIVEAEEYPISIIIIGVGRSSFTNCKIFDADDKRLVHSNGRKQKRDIVQFVKFDDYKQDLKLLTDEVLFEIPGQVVNYMMMQ